MVTGELKNKIDGLWLIFFTGGLTNPLDVIEQLTYLMFIRSLDEKELETEQYENLSGEAMDKIFPLSSTGQSMRWSKFKDRDPREIFDIIAQRVFPAIKNLKNGKLPDYNEKGEMILPEDGEGDTNQEKTAFACYMEDAMFLIPTPQVEPLPGLCRCRRCWGIQ